MNENETVDNEVEETTEQESPAAEENQPESEGSEAAEKPEETPDEEEEGEAEDKNWRAVREELDRLKSENAQLKGGEPSPQVGRTRNELDSVYLSPTEEAALGKEELKAELKYPELEKKNIFSMAVVGEYRSALDNYNLSKTMGKPARLPSVYEIASRVKSELDSSLGTTAKKAEEEGAKKAKAAKANREATVEAEGRSDRARTSATSAELSRLRRRSQEGDINAVAERLENLGD